MSMGDALKNGKNFSLIDIEGVEVNLKKSKNSSSKEYVLAAKFMTKWALNVESIGRTFKPLWKSQNGFKIRDVGNHVLLFVFKVENDVESILSSI